MAASSILVRSNVKVLIYTKLMAKTKTLLILTIPNFHATVQHVRLGYLLALPFNIKEQTSFHKDNISHTAEYYELIFTSNPSLQLLDFVWLAQVPALFGRYNDK